jgi:ADP-heptose:LPS heptosyltransferase
MYRRFIDAPWYFCWPNIATELKSQGFLLPVTVRPDVEWLIEDPAAILSANGIESEYIVLIPGSAARHLQKRWPAYSELADVLTASGYRPIIAPGPDEMEMAKAFNCPVLLQDGKPVSLTLLAGLVRNARYFVGNDTGPTHLAAYLGTKGLALFGPHASAQSTGLDRYLDIIEVSDLKRLPVHDVAERVNAAMTSDVH